VLYRIKRFINKELLKIEKEEEMNKEKKPDITGPFHCKARHSRTNPNPILYLTIEATDQNDSTYTIPAAAITMKPAAQREEDLRFGGAKSPAAEELEGVQQQLDRWRILLSSYSGMTSACVRLAPQRWHVRAICYAAMACTRDFASDFSACSA
jgi:hypothetical protein